MFELSIWKPCTIRNLAKRSCILRTNFQREDPELPRETADDSAAKGAAEPETSHFAKKRALQKWRGRKSVKIQAGGASASGKVTTSKEMMTGRGLQTTANYFKSQALWYTPLISVSE